MIINSDKPYTIYAEHLEPDAINQFQTAMGCEFTVRGALMPDAHTGYSLPIGSVIETDGVIVPSWVGYDIGCGMCAIKTNFDCALVKENATNIFNEIYKRIPVGL